MVILLAINFERDDEMKVGDEITVRCENPKCDCGLPEGKDIVGIIKNIDGYSKGIIAKVDGKTIKLGEPGSAIWKKHNAMHPDYVLPAGKTLMIWKRVFELQKIDQMADYDTPYMMNSRQITSRGMTHIMDDVEFFGKHYSESQIVWARAYMDREDEHGTYRVYGSGGHLGYFWRVDQIKPYEKWEDELKSFDNFNDKAIDKCREYLKKYEWIPLPICKDCDREIPDHLPKQKKYCSCGQEIEYEEVD